MTDIQKVEFGLLESFVKLPITTVTATPLPLIFQVFQQACNDIVETSQNNPNETSKIDFVVVTKSYLLSNITSNVLSSNVTSEIGTKPMENISDDWEKFVTHTKNLMESVNGYFNTDYGNYSLICMNSAIGELTSDKIKKGDVPAMYKRTRKQISIDEPSEILEQYINKIRAIHSNQTGNKFLYIKLPKKCKVISGDNWYIIFDEQGILDSCCLPLDTCAKKEFNTVNQELIKNYEQNENDTLRENSKK